MANHSRRRWLAGSAASLAALHWCELPLPAAEGLKQFSFAIVSDTHLGRANGAAPERQWRQAIAEINESSADFVLHLGDVVDSGRPEQYPLYAATRGDLKQPIYEVPGNHDPHPLFEKHVRTPIDAAVDHAGVRFLLLGNAHTDSHLGFITPEQIAWLDKQCADAAASDLQIVVACHVPVHTNSHPDRGWHVKPDDGQRAFYELAERHAERLLACLHGHFHNGIRGWRDRGQMVEVLVPSVCYNQSRKLEQAIAEKKAGGFFVEELRPGYVLATLGNGRLTLRYKPLGAAPHGEYQADWS
jgi:3',5'-cyclic AMP phosphodiesterase CpdA